MLMDELGEFLDDANLSQAGTSLVLIGDVIDLGAAAKPIIDGPHQVYLVIKIGTVAVASGGASTVQFFLASDAQAAIAVDGSATIHWSSAAIPKATLVAGYYVAKVPLPANSPEYERYLGILQLTGTAALTAGKVDAFLTLNPPTWTPLADASN